MHEISGLPISNIVWIGHGFQFAEKSYETDFALPSSNLQISLKYSYPSTETILKYHSEHQVLWKAEAVWN